MKEIVILIIALMVVSVGVLSGCNEQTTPNSDNENTNVEVIDTDGDDYPDNEDDFPSDPNLHEKLGRSYTETLTHGGGKGHPIAIMSDCKYIDVKWRVDNPTDLTEEEQNNLVFQVTIPPDTEITTEYLYKDVSNRNLRFTIDYSNVGDWDFVLMYKDIPGPYEQRDMTVTYEIYWVK